MAKVTSTAFTRPSLHVSVKPTQAQCGFNCTQCFRREWEVQMGGARLGNDVALRGVAWCDVM